MNALSEYISGRAQAPSPRKLNRLVERFEWFTTARRVRALITGDPDARLTLPLSFWPTILPVTSSAARQGHLIENFIAHGGYKIVPSDQTREVDVDIEIDPEMVSVELAEIYRSQGLVEKADEIYRILSLRSS